MELSGLLAAIMSVGSYLQNLGATINLPSFDLPDSVRKIFQYVTKFLDGLFVLVGMPAFDVRAQLVIIAFILPFLLTIVFIWFVTPFLQVLQQLLDLLVVIFTSMAISESLFYEWTTGTKLATVTGFAFIFFRLIMTYLKRVKHPIKLDQLASNICNFYMSAKMHQESEETLVPKADSSLTNEELGHEINNCCRYVEFSAAPPSKLFTIAMAGAAAVILLVSLWAMGLLPLPVDLPVMLRVFFPYIGIPFTLILLIVLVMNITACGRNGLLCLKRFIKRWGLRLLMLCLDLLYIPILTGVIPLLTPKNATCGAGYYLAYDRVPRTNDPFFDFVNHTARCLPCLSGSIEYMPVCLEACAGRHELRLMEYLNLEFMNDILKPVGPLILYCLSVGMMGIPALFYHITLRNRRFVRNIYVYGSSIHDKWNNIVQRLETTGIFLFSMYKYPKFWWSIALFGVKLVVMFITSIAGRVWKYVYIGLPAFYMIVVFLHGYHRPYLLGPLTVLNFVLYILQALHCLIPICAMFGKPILDGVYVPIAIALIVIPILSCVLILCCQRNSFDDDDPTIPDNRKKNKSKKGGGTSFQDADWDIQAGQFFKAAGGHLHTRSSCADGPAQSGGNLARKTTLIGEDLDQSQPPVWKPIPAGGMEMIADFEAKERAHAKHMKNYEVNTVVMQPAIGEMYKVLDYVIDGVTIGTLIRTVYWAMIIGSMAFGWYLGALRGVVRGREMVACGEA